MSEDIKFEDMVKSLVKPGKSILESLTPEKADILHMGFGLTGEVGELIDALKRYVIYEKDLDRDNVVEELGDIEFFLEHIRQLLNISREETLHQNIEKLKVRYEGIKYSNEAAQNRADKA
jgi:NTP pyrophosphatase (non-canonical NTP hydrolase)